MIDDDAGRARMTTEQIVATFRPLLDEGIAAVRTFGPDDVRAAVMANLFPEGTKAHEQVKDAKDAAEEDLPRGRLG